MADSIVKIQAGVIPFRVGKRGVEVCLITTRRSKRWSFPKGSVSEERSRRETALLEAKEEAGLSGRILEPVGTYAHQRDGRQFEVTMYLMEVSSCDRVWQEMDRDRLWVNPSEAKKLITKPGARGVLQAALNLIDDLENDVKSSAA